MKYIISGEKLAAESSFRNEQKNKIKSQTLTNSLAPPARPEQLTRFRN